MQNASAAKTATLRPGDRVRTAKGPLIGVVERVWTPQYGFRGERPQAKVRFPRGAMTARADRFTKVEER